MRKTFLTALVIFLLFSCKKEEKGAPPLFSLLPFRSTGVDFSNRLSESEKSNMIEYLYFNNGAGVAVGDINNDGLTDIYFTSNQQPNKLYLNKGNLKFEDITEAAGVAGTGSWKTGVTMADVNGDGLLDIYVCEVGDYKSYKGKNQLFINQGNLTFKDEAHEYGLDFSGFSTQAAFFDYDLDGDLDMFLLNHSVHSSRSYGMASLRFERDSLAGGRLYRNDEVNGRHVFHDVTKSAGIYSSQIAYGLGVNICDINNDGYPDIYESNDFHENDYMYINNGDGTFRESLTSMFGHTSRSSMGNDIGDINNDGLPDIMVLDMLPDREKIRKQSGGEDDYDLFMLKLKYGYYYQFVRNTLQLNLGGGLFSEIGLLAGVASTDWSWSPLICDLDNDGWKDIFITSGIYRRANDLDYVKYLTGGKRFFPEKDNKDKSDKELYEKMPLYPNESYLYKNAHNLTFSNKATEWGITKKSFSNGSAYADLDNDGDLDLIVNNINEKAFIYRNNSEKKLVNHFLSVRLEGSGLNTKGTGSYVRIYSNGMQQVEWQFPVRGFLSTSSDVLHFGLGNFDTIDSLNVIWPDRSEQIITNFKADRLLTLKQEDASKNSRIREKTDHKNLLCSATTIPGLLFEHREDQYIDFYREQLIPHSLSAEGPALASADINGDGIADIFAGGAKGQQPVIFIQQKDGSFKSQSIPVLANNLFADITDAAFFDADGDGDQDLYIVHGGNELNIGNPVLSDILLINDGKGNFSKGNLPLISHNGSCISPCDFDGDGDIDLFIGSRSVPGAYGLSPFQYLLENDGSGHFTDVTDKRALDLKSVGMVTGACWFDYDHDGDMDLAVLGEWMNIHIFRNDKGYFTDITDAAGFGNTSGWWNCIRAADIDGDGNIDLICGNLGLNSLLKASPEEPAEIYINDFDNSGSADQIICTYIDGKSYPIASLDEMGSQITGLKEKYKNYSDFGGKTAVDIFGKEKINQSIVKKAVLFESSLFMNNGNGTFRKVVLPAEAQFSPVRDILSCDLNHDGKVDLILAGNDYAVRPSIGRYDASYGWCLIGDNKGSFKALMPAESGLIIKGDARKIVLLESNGDKYLVAAVNNGNVQLFKLLK